MNLTTILDDLRREREQIDEAILSLERLAAGSPRRGRPPAWLKAHQRRGRPPAAAKNSGKSLSANKEKAVAATGD
jgi:hypothetical protein